MKYISQMQKMKVFSLADVVKLVGNERTAKSVLAAYKKARYIASVRRNLYVALDLSTKIPIADRFQIGSQIQGDGYLAFHSALEYHGVANQIFYTMVIVSSQRFTPFSYNGINYEHCGSAFSDGVIVPERNRLVKVTDIERTVADCLYDLDRAGGFEEVWKALQLLSSLNEDKLLHYLNSYDQIFLWQKAGFVLQQLSTNLHLSEVFFSVCRSKIHEHKRSLTNTGTAKYFPEWKLYVSEYDLSVIEEGDDPVV